MSSQVDPPETSRFALPDRDRPISVAAEVRWSRQERSPNSEGHASGMGLRFVNLPVGAFILIRELLRSSQGGAQGTMQHTAQS